MYNAMLDECLTALTGVLGNPGKEIPLHEPNFSGNEWEYVKSCIDSGWVSSVGEYVTLFEQKLVDYTNIPYAVAVVNGTAALHTCLILSDIKSNDEVLLPSLTFVATANAIAYCGAVCHFVDSDSRNLGIDLEKLATYLKSITVIKENTCFNKYTNRRIKAIIPVHIFGHPVDMMALQEIAKQYYLTVIEDATESLGSFYQDKHTGAFGDIACLSFNGNKIVTAGGGGAILIKNTEMAKRAKHITTTAKLPHRYKFYHNEIAYNYRLPNLNAALGCAQLEQLPNFVIRKRNLADQYLAAFSKLSYARILKETPNCQSNYWLNALILNKPDRIFVDQFIEIAQKQKFGLRGLWDPLDSLPMYSHCPKMDLANTYALYDSVIALPSGTTLG